MIKPGFTTTDPATQTRTVVLEIDREANGRDFVWEIYCPPGAGPFVLEHVHTDWVEKFQIIQGEARYKIDGIEGTAKAGDLIELPPGKPHIHPWNDGEGEMIYHQIVELPAPNPQAIQEVMGTFATLFGLAREGKVNKKGLPRNPLQFAATLRTLVRHEGFDASAPIGAQRLIAATLGRVAEALGYRSSYSRYLETAETVVNN